MRVQGLPIRDCAKGCTNRGQSRPMMSAIDVTAKTFFERFYLVLGLCTFEPWVNCPCAPTTPTVHSTTISRFLCNFFPRLAPHFLIITIHQVIWPSPGTLPGMLQVFRNNLKIFWHHIAIFFTYTWIRAWKICLGIIRIMSRGTGL